MNVFIDCEFNGAEGSLISMALISEDGKREFYEVVDCTQSIDPWVAENVMPYLEKQAITYSEFQRKLAVYLKQFPTVHVVADYPDDISRLCRAMITGAGEWMMIQPITFEIDDKLSAKAAKVRHNALHDVRAIRLSWFENNGYNAAE